MKDSLRESMALDAVHEQAISRPLSHDELVQLQRVAQESGGSLGLSDLAATAWRDTRRGKNTVHRLDGLFRQSVFGRLAGYEDVNDADRLALAPVMRQVVGGRAVDAQAASASQMGRFETETLALPENRAALTDLNGQWIDRFHERNGLKYIVCICKLRELRRNITFTIRHSTKENCSRGALLFWVGKLVVGASRTPKKTVKTMSYGIYWSG